LIHAGVVLEKVQYVSVLIVDILKKDKMDKYNKRTWLNSKSSSSTSSIIAFDGDVLYDDKIYRDTFLKIYDCRNSISLHKKNDESMEYFIKKMKLLKKEIELFINHLENI